MSWTPSKTWIKEILTKEDLNTYLRDNVNFLKINVAWGEAAELTIAAGVVTATQSFHKIDTEDDAASDDLDTINGGTEGEIKVFRIVDASRKVTFKAGTGNLDFDADILLGSPGKMLMLLHDGTNWQVLNYLKEHILAYGVVGRSHVGRVKAA